MSAHYSTRGASGRAVTAGLPSKGTEFGKETTMNETHNLASVAMLAMTAFTAVLAWVAANVWLATSILSMLGLL